jgi:glucosylglycerol-phosphate synthase
MKSNLVIVYHRQPYEEVVEDGKTVYRENKSPNGIVPTLKSFFGEVDRGAWVAWKEAEADAQPDFERVVRIEDSFGAYNVSRLPLTKEQVKSFYHVTSKEALWPILHSFPEKYDYEPVDWSTFREVNWLFAEAAAAEAEDDAWVWVHDYNLWLVPKYLRQLKPNLRIAFFHHTPFPSADLFSVLPWREEIIDALLECDLVGFHIPRYAANFAAAARALRGVEIESEVKVEEGLSPVRLALSEPTVATRIRHGDRHVNVDAFPVGTNADYIQQIVERVETQRRVEEIEKELAGRCLIVSVARTDYTKGTREMLTTFERLLERRPELREKIVLWVTSVSANTNMTVYQEAQRDIEATVGRINGRFGSLGWQPIIFFTQAVPFQELIAYYKAADICWITPLRDGLNLIAKEFVAAKAGDDGVLVLSEFAGTSVELPHAVLCNPYSSRSMDAAIDQALDMSEEEQRARMDKLVAGVRNYDIAHWASHTLERFDEIAKLSRRGRARTGQGHDSGGGSGAGGAGGPVEGEPATAGGRVASGARAAEARRPRRLRIDGRIPDGYVVLCDCSHAFVQERLSLTVQCPHCGTTAFGADLATDYTLAQKGENAPHAVAPGTRSEVPAAE